MNDTAPASVRITDLARPRLPLPLRTVNWLGQPWARSLIGLDMTELMNTARRQAGLDDFGPDSSFLEPLRTLLFCLDKEADLSFLGRIGARRFILQQLQNRLLIEGVIRRHPEILAEKIERPIIIAGLPRTGTTHLHSLLSQDQNLQYLAYYELLEPVLSAREQTSGNGQDPRIARCRQSLETLDWMMPYFQRMHELSVEGCHEEINIFTIHFSSMLFENMYRCPTYRDWYRQADHRPAYDFLKRVLQMFQWQRRSQGQRWVLKSPQHLETLDALIDTFPDARIVQTHRDPVRITASTLVMDTYGKRMATREVDLRINGRYWSRRVEDLLYGAMEGRRKLPQEQVTDVIFPEFIKDQIGTVERLYRFFELPFTEQARQAMAAFIAANPKGRHGTVDYVLEDFGIDPQERRAALRPYQTQYGVPDEE